MADHSQSDSQFSNVRNQILASIIASGITFNYGCTCGWFSPAIPTIVSDNTPLITGPVTTEQLSWIGSMNSVGSVFGTFLFGIISLKLGSKISLTLMAIPPTIFWILIKFGNTYYHILIARLCAGLTGGGFQTGAVLFISEISDPNYRGRLGALIPLTRNFGVLIAFFVGSIVEYGSVPFIFIAIPPIFMMLLIFLKNTPQQYLRSGKNQEAKTALKWYKGCAEKNEYEKSILNLEFERLKQVNEERKNSPKIELKDYTNRMALKGIFICLALSWFTQLTGCYIITNYASLVFEKSGSALDVSSIILIVAQIVGGLVSSQIGDMFSRRRTICYSLSGCILGFCSLSIYLYLRQNGIDVSNFTWLPVLIFGFSIFISSAGIIAIVNTCAVENFPSKIRTPSLTIYSLSMNMVQFFGEKFFPILVELLYLHGLLLLLAINCCIGLVFVAFCMNETKGKSLDTTESDQNKTSI